PAPAGAATPVAAAAIAAAAIALIAGGDQCYIVVADAAARDHLGPIDEPGDDPKAILMPDRQLTRPQAHQRGLGPAGARAQRRLIDQPQRLAGRLVDQLERVLDAVAGHREQ